MITLLYFGKFKSIFQTASEQIEWQGGNGHDLLALLQSRGGVWAESLSAQQVFRLVINKRISNWEDPIDNGAEVGLLPPVTGG